METRFLIARWLGPAATPIPIYDEASVSSARQLVRDAGRSLNARSELIETAAVIASELTHNQLRHAKQGYFAVNAITRGAAMGIEMIAADIGPGMDRPLQAITDEIPTGHSLRAGLAAVCRLSDEVEFDNRMEEGLCVVARKFEGSATTDRGLAIMGRPFPGEIISGDDAALFETEFGFVAVTADGLGHGPEAREASKAAIDSVARLRETGLAQMIVEINDDLSRTRGCAISLVRFDKISRLFECVSMGDVYTHLYHRRDAHFFTSTPFIVGASFQRVPKVRIETAAAEPDSVLVMFTDGLKSRTTLKGELERLRQPAIGIAQHLLENNARPDDDALVLVAKV
jgi:anti-sigma regulatory factor (Ser/Thr protein kinase)